MKKTFFVLFALFAAVSTALPAFAQQRQQQRLRGQFGQGGTYEEIIRNDHKIITQLFNRINQSQDLEERRVLFDQLKEGLRQHMDAEEEYLYPALRQEQPAQGVAVMAVDQHAAARRQLGNIDLNDDPEVVNARLKVLQSLIDEHVTMEEGQLLPQAGQLLDQNKRQEITRQFQEAYR